MRLSIVALWGSVLIGAWSCSSPFLPSDPTFSDGDRLEAIDYGETLPASRADYAAMATFLTPGRVQIVDPGTGPNDPPVVLRSIRIDDHVLWDAQISDDGYLWVAPPDRSGGGALRVFYVIDPHTATVHRSIAVPPELRAVAGLTVGPTEVYVRAWRDGFSGGIGAVSRSCVSTASVCSVRLAADLGNVGTTPERALHLLGGALYSLSLGNSRDERLSTARLDPSTGAVTGEYPLAESSTFDAEHLYVIPITAPGEQALVRLDRLTLEVEASTPIPVNSFNIAHQNGQIFVSHFSDPVVRVYDSGTLALVRTVDVSAAGQPEAAFGFFATDVLLLNHRSWLNTETDEVVTGDFPLQATFSQAFRLPQGHPLAS